MARLPGTETPGPTKFIPRVAGHRDTDTLSSTSTVIRLLQYPLHGRRLFYGCSCLLPVRDKHVKKKVPSHGNSTLSWGSVPFLSPSLIFRFGGPCAPTLCEPSLLNCFDSDLSPPPTLNAKRLARRWGDLLHACGQGLFYGLMISCETDGYESQAARGEAA